MQRQVSKATGAHMPSFKEFSLERLADLLKEFLKSGNTLDLTDLDAVHELRIAGKRLRYTLDSLAPALPDKAHLLSKRLEKLQDLLGRIQDVTFTPPLLHELVKASSSRLTHQDAGLITGWQLARSLAAVDNWDRVWTKVEKAASKVKKLKLYDEDAANKRSPEM
jgi:CHAD domain-containing protein